jgi:CubicO group peptidase (beta-lactamase class C family)
LIAAELGHLNLDDPIEKFLPAFRDAMVKTSAGLVKPAKRPTIRHLLTHTSGISSYDPGGLTDEQKAKLTLSDYAAKLGLEPLEHQPGQAIAYSGVGFSAAAAIVQLATKTPFEAFVGRHILRPLGMTDTTFFLSKSQASRLATTYTRSDAGRLIPFEHDAVRKGARFANGAGGLYSTAADMAKFILAFGPKPRTRILSPQAVQTMTKLHTGELPLDGGDERGFGLGWSVVRNPGGQMQFKSIGTFGHTGAFGTEFWLDPSTGVAAIYMVQGFGLSDAGRKSFSTMVNSAIIHK